MQVGVSAYSIELWMRINISQLTAMGSSVQQIAVVNDRGSTGSGTSLTLAISTPSGGSPSPACVQYTVDGTFLIDGVIQSTYSTVSDGGWHHVVGTWNGTSGQSVVPGQFALYIDGHAVSVSATTLYASALTAPVTGSGYTVVGYSSAWGTYFPGSLSSIAIYTYALSAAQVYDHYLQCISS
jgi:hypothetical protein